MSFERDIVIGELLFYVFVIIMFITKGFGMYDGQTIYKVFFVISMLLIVFKIVITKYYIEEFVIAFFLFLLAIIINRVTGEKGPLIIVAIIVGMRNVSLDRVMKIGVFSLGGSAFINAVVYMFRTPNVGAYLRTSRLGIHKSYAWDLGQPHPNTTSIVYLAVVALFLLCIEKRYNLKYMLLLSVGNLAVFYFCASNTGFITCELLIIFSFIFVKIKKWPNWCTKALNFGYPICVLFSCIFPWMIGDSFLLYLKNNMLSLYGRIIQTRSFVTKDNMSFFGVNVSSITDSKYVIENSFLYCLMFEGFFFFILISAGYIFFISRYVKQQKYVELCITMCFLLEGIFEPFLFNTSFKNITVFFLGECIWDCFKRNKNDDVRIICLLQLPILGDKVGKKIDTVYLKIVKVIDDLLKKDNSGDKDQTKRTNIVIVSVFAFTILLLKIWPITEDFFSASGMYDILMEYNELEKGMIMETIRRFIFLYILNISFVYVVSGIYEHIYKKK